MAKLTGGAGWSLSPDDFPKPASPKNGDAPIPKIRLEKRVGKTVTVIAGLHTHGAIKLEAIARELKTLCGAGGTVKNGVIEIQGDRIKFVRAWLSKNLSVGEKEPTSKGVAPFDD